MTAEIVLLQTAAIILLQTAAIILLLTTEISSTLNNDYNSSIMCCEIKVNVGLINCFCFYKLILRSGTF